MRALAALAALASGIGFDPDDIDAIRELKRAAYQRGAPKRRDTKRHSPKWKRKAQRLARRAERANRK